MHPTASEILSHYWDASSVPIDPAYIAARMGVAVLADPRLAGSGYYTPNGEKNAPLITYNPTENIFRQRFVVAHQLGHHVLQHGESDKNTAVELTMAALNQNELTANKFAVDLLLPDDFVGAAIMVEGIAYATQLARRFAVSIGAMRYKLKELGYRENVSL